jgi:hypothetical protein
MADTNTPQHDGRQALERETLLEDARHDVRRLFRYVIQENRLDETQAAELAAAFVAINAVPAGQFDAQQETVLWSLLTRLSRLAAPTTVTGLRIAADLEDDQRHRPSWLRRWNQDAEARRTVRKTVLLLAGCLFLLLSLQIYALVGEQILKELHQDSSVWQEILHEERQLLANAPANPSNSGPSLPMLEIAERKQAMERHLFSDVCFLQQWSMHWLAPSPDGLALAQHCENRLEIKSPAADSQAYEQLRALATNSRLDGELRARNTLQALAMYILPLLYGLLGAIVFVLRRITQELTEYSFRPLAALQYASRYALGAVSGATAGLFFSPTQQGTPESVLTLAAVAFLSGFSVEGVFARLDALVALLRDSGGKPAAPNKPNESPTG